MESHPVFRKSLIDLFETPTLNFSYHLDFIFSSNFQKCKLSYFLFAGWWLVFVLVGLPIIYSCHSLIKRSGKTSYQVKEIISLLIFLAASYFILSVKILH